MFAEFTDRTAKVMSLANQEARRSGHKVIGGEHILLGLLKEGSGKAVKILKHFDVDIEKLSTEVEAIVEATGGAGEVATGKIPQSLGAQKLGTEHLLLGILSVPDLPAAQLLTQHGLKIEDVKAELQNLHKDHSIVTQSLTGRSS